MAKKNLINKVNRGAAIHTSDSYEETAPMPVTKNKEIVDGKFKLARRKTIQIDDVELYHTLRAIKTFYPETLGKTYSDIIKRLTNIAVNTFSDADRKKIDEFVKLQTRMDKLTGKS